MSTHAVRVIRIDQVYDHPNGDRLDIIPIPGSMWQCITQKGTFKRGDLAIYIEPDYVVPTARPEFSWLAKPGDGGKYRMRAAKLRGVTSFGLLIPAPIEPMVDMDDKAVGMRLPREGDNFMRALGIERWVPPTNDAADSLKGDWPVAPNFDMEALRNHPDTFALSEPVVVTEKLHGTSARYLFKDGTFYVGCRTRWLDPTFSNHWTRAVTPAIKLWCEAHEGTVLYGEIVGPGVEKGFTYGQAKPTFFAFDAWAPGDRWNQLDGVKAYGVRAVPLVYFGPWDPSRVLPYAETDSGVEGAPKDHIMEGLVIQPTAQRGDPTLGRVILKHISDRYWTSKHA